MKTNTLLFIVLVWCLSIIGDAQAATLCLPITKDTSISSVGKEQTGNNGRASRLKIKSIQEYILFDVDVADLKGLVLADAWLHVTTASPAKAPVKRAGVSTVASNWGEGHGTRLRQVPGGACFVQAALGEQDWAYPGSTLMDVVFGRGNTVWDAFAPIGPDRDGGQVIRISPDVVAARVAGISYGFCLYDDVGSEWEETGGRFIYEHFPNRIVYSRESRQHGPWMAVAVKGRDTEPPCAVSEIFVDTRDLPAGEAFVSWQTPEDLGIGRVLGFDVSWRSENGQGKFPRYLIPMAGTVGSLVKMHIRDMGFGPGEVIQVRVASVDSAGNRGPGVTAQVAVSAGFERVDVGAGEVMPFGESRGLRRGRGRGAGEASAAVQVRILDLLDKQIEGHPDFSGGLGNHIYSDEENLIRLHGARNEFVGFQVHVVRGSGDISLEMQWENEDISLETKIYRFGHVAVKQGFFRTWQVPDPLVPVGEGNHISHDSPPAYVCDIYIPHDASPGKKRGKLVITAGDDVMEMDLDLTVWDFTLPDKLSFVPEMNAYARVSPYKGYAYYRLAHRHRTCLNRLPYGWNGLPEFAPEKAGPGFDFSRWERHVGPLLDGSAFRKLPRRHQPVDVMYLPFSENWPVPLAGNYEKSWWPKEALSDAYRDKLAAYFAAFARYIRDRGWDRTEFQFYLNNKVYYREKFAGSSAPWIFDEPVNIQDFTALKWYGDLWHGAVDPIKGQTRQVFRCDISYTQYGRDILWGVSDIDYLGGNNAQKTRMKHEEMVRHPGTRFAEYGTANDLLDANTQPVLWQLSAWAKGAVRILPWQTIGSADCWEKGEQTALFYPGEFYPGEGMVGRVYPSIRLKAFRYGQQLVEYLELLGEVLEVPDDAVRHWVTMQLGNAAAVRKTSGKDAGTFELKGKTIIDLWKLRLTVGNKIHEGFGVYKNLEKNQKTVKND